MSIKLVVFDWNGTLLADSMAVVQAANKSEIPMLGLKPVTLNQLRETYEVPIVHAYEKLGVSPELFREKSAETSEAFHRHYEPLAARTHTRPGTRAMLQALHSNHIQRIILSNHTMEGIFLQLDRLKLQDYFDAVLANEAIGNAHYVGKQHRLERYLATTNYQPDEVAIIGDTPEEVRIGRALGIRTIAISGGVCARHRLVSAKPDTLVASVNQILKAVEEMA